MPAIDSVPGTSSAPENADSPRPAIGQRPDASGLVQIQHFRRPAERAFTAEERDRVTILFGGLTWRHEELIRAVFLGSGYKCEIIPTPDVDAFQAGKEYGNNGQCNPTYFTVGNLVRYLQGLEAAGMSRKDIIDNYVFFTAGSCGPCRFGMYEAEYRFALDNAGFGGFRVLLFQQNHGIKAASGEAGLKFTVNFGLGMLNALHIGDTLNDLLFQIRPFEVEPGSTDRLLREATAGICDALRDRKPYEFKEDAPAWIRRRLEGRRALENTASVLCKVADHLYGKDTLRTLEACNEQLNRIEVDRLRVKPVVKIVGEFWAQTTDGDGNFNMFQFLEREGAQVVVEPIATWVAYMIHQVRHNAVRRHRLESLQDDTRWYDLRQRAATGWKFRRKLLMLSAGEYFWTLFYHRVTDRLGGITHHLVPQVELARLAHPFYNSHTRGGEGHLEVGKNVYYTKHNLAHMVLALKPFGCMPSTQSDGAQSAVANKFRDMIFLPIETSGEGEVNAHSRVQMALGDAKAKARAEFEQALASTGQSLEDIRDFVHAHPEMNRPFYRVPHTPGVAGTAAQFVLHAGRRMKRRRFLPAFPV